MNADTAATATAPITTIEITRISATVTRYEGDGESPRDWAGYVAERLADEYPWARITVSYGARDQAWCYGTTDEPIEDFGYLINLWWDELCAHPDHDQWSHLPPLD